MNNLSQFQRQKRKRLPNITNPDNNSQQKQPENINALIQYMEECINQKKSQAYLLQFIAYLQKIDIKKLSFLTLTEQKSFFMMRTLNNWISEIFITKQKDYQLPSYIITITEFFRFAIRSFRSKFNNQKMTIAYAFHLNNLANFLLRSKQYKSSIQYLLEAAKLHDKQKIMNPVFSVIFTNLSILYFLLKEQIKGQSYLLKGLKISKYLHKKYLEQNDTKSFGFQQNVNILIHMYITLIDLYESQNEVKKKINEIQKAAMQLIVVHYVKINKKTWFIKYFFDRKKKSTNRYSDSPFEIIFKINIQELRFYSTDIFMMQTSRKKQGILPNVNNSIIHEDTPKHLKDVKIKFDGNQSKNYNDLMNIIIEKFQKKQIQVQEMVEIAMQDQSKIKKNKKKMSYTSEQKIIFKNTFVQIRFHDQGLILRNTFSQIQQRLDWDLVKMILSQLDLNQLQQSEVEAQCNQHLIARILSNHIQIADRIKIKKKAFFQFSTKTQNFSYNFNYIGNKQFIVSVNTIKNQVQQFSYSMICVVECIERYFKIIKQDEYRLYLKDRLCQLKKNKINNNFYLDVIKLSSDPKDPIFQDDLKPLINVLETVEKNLDNTFFKLVLKFQENEKNTLGGILYQVRSLNLQQKLEIEIKKLNQYDCDIINTQQLRKYVSFSFIEAQLGVKIQSLNKFEQFWIKHFISDTFQLITQFITNEFDAKIVESQRRNQIIFYVQRRTIETGKFKRIFINKKYYKPLTISIVGIKKKCFGIKFSSYQQINATDENIFVLCSQDWYNIQKEQKQKLLKQNNSILKFHKLCDIIGSIDLIKNYQKLIKYKKENRANVITMEKFLDLIIFQQN